jgi:glycosyltransferase involved in cell wall biosynthesis
MSVKVSIIIPTYNVECYIEECLLSVLNQTYSNFEILLVNDCTPDNSMEVVHRVINNHARGSQIQILEHNHNKGLSAARNTGVKASTGDYLFFLDSDDEITYSAIESLVLSIEGFQGEGVDFAIGGVQVIGSSLYSPLLSNRKLHSNRDIFTDFVLRKWNVMACNKLINKEFFLKNSMWFKEGLLHEDELFSFRLAVCANTMSAVYEETYIYKCRLEGSITSSVKIKNIQDLILIFSENYSLVKQMYSFKNNLPIYLYFVNLAYALLYKVSRSKIMDLNTKHKLSSQILFIFKKIKMSYNLLTLKTLFKIVTIHTYFIGGKLILNLHSKLSK